MSIDFSALLTSEQKRALLEQRIAQFAAEGYQHQLNKVTLEALGDTESLERTNQNIATIQAAIATHQAELEKLES